MRSDHKTKLHKSKTLFVHPVVSQKTLIILLFQNYLVTAFRAYTSNVDLMSHVYQCHISCQPNAKMLAVDVNKGICCARTEPIPSNASAELQEQVTEKLAKKLQQSLHSQNSYWLFCNEMRPSLKLAHPSASMVELGRLLGREVSRKICGNV